ncbi:D-alanyl-D-alanine carboxypeptidase family protein [Robertmurraya massiliosenegalensis]|uniref:D-alanyl-D-alanine carboxypeptidase family protein n=1 Tax=Robertmurraya massiliosenegalensis TaxID=1287657 RepID=UPI000303859E|nr:D-alanyl-D-alanine carboxypeptidase family protein [Robertmurraya massiliosenegalensis]
MNKKYKNKLGTLGFSKNNLNFDQIAKKTLSIFIIPILLNLAIQSNTFADKPNEDPKILSEAAILIEESSGRVLYEKNADHLMYPASLTKVATAIYAIEKGNLEDLVTVSERARQVDGTRVYLEVGEKVSLRKLIQGLLINSGNDAGVAIAEYLDGSEEEFAASLNAYLQGIGLNRTHFVNPHGLFNPNHTTTARDLAIMTQYSMKNADFREIFGIRDLKWDGEVWDTTIYNHHKLMRERPYEGITGGKTGYVDESKHTLITTAKRGNMSVIAVVLKGQSQDIIYNDTVELLDYAFNNFELVAIPKGKEYSLNGKKFITNEMYSFPITNNEEITEEITKEGLLEIKNQFQEKIVTFPIREMKTPEIKKEKQMTEEKAGNFGSLNSVTFIVVIGIVSSFIFLRIKKKRIRLRKFW